LLGIYDQNTQDLDTASLLTLAKIDINAKELTFAYSYTNTYVYVGSVIEDSDGNIVVCGATANG
jgi:hypothetical protein